MTDDQQLLPPGQLSPSRELVPYPLGSREILLRHNDRVVVYDPDLEPSNQLTASRVSQEDLAQCPLCHRPFDQDEQVRRSSASNVDNDDDDDSDDDVPDVQANYFRLLADSRHATPTSGTPRPAVGRLPFLPGLPQSSPRDVSRESGAASADPQAEQHDHISADSVSPGYLHKFFHVERELGRGGRGVVLLVRHVLDGVMLGRFACKRIPVGDDHKWLQHVLLEVSMLQEISHKNLVSYRHVWLEDFKPSPFGPSIPHVYILQQYCNGGTLFDHVLGPDKEMDAKENFRARLRRRSQHQGQAPAEVVNHCRLSFDDIITFFKDITSGVAHLHAQGLVHRDLKPQNCLLHRSGNTIRALVSDFGEMQSSTERRGPLATGYTGTISFAAPEVLTRGPDGSYGDFTPKSDVFSLGMIVYFMCFARLPYVNSDGAMREENEDIELLRAEISAWQGLGADRTERSDLPEALYLYLRRLLSQSPSERPSTEDILHAIKANASSAEDGTPPPTRASRPTSPSAPTGVDGVRKSSPPHSSPANQTAFVEEDSEPTLFQRRSRSSTQTGPAPLWGPGTGRVKPGSISPGAALVRSSRRQSTIVHSPTGRLLLPAPPQRWYTRIWETACVLIHRPEFALSIRLMALLAKVASLIGPCTPLTPSEKLLYPLIVLAAIDIAQAVTITWSMALLTVHVAVLVMAQRLGTLCARPSQLWDVDQP